MHTLLSSLSGLLMMGLVPDSLPLDGVPVLVWLEGPLADRLPKSLLSVCYLADGDQQPYQVICLD